MDVLGYLLLALMGIAFYEMFIRLRMMGDIQRVLQIAPEAARVIRSSTLRDEEKESIVRRMSLTVLKDTMRFVVKLVVILVVCAALVVAGHLLLALPAEQLRALLVSWKALLALAVFVLLYSRVRRA